MCLPSYWLEHKIHLKCRTDVCRTYGNIISVSTIFIFKTSVKKIYIFLIKVFIRYFINSYFNFGEGNLEWIPITLSTLWGHSYSCDLVLQTESESGHTMLVSELLGTSEELFRSIQPLCITFIHG